MVQNRFFFQVLDQSLFSFSTSQTEEKLGEARMVVSLDCLVVWCHEQDKRILNIKLFLRHGFTNSEFPNFSDWFKDFFDPNLNETTESNKQLGIGEPIYRDLDLYDPYI